MCGLFRTIGNVPHMKAHQSVQHNISVRSSELFFGILMLIIILLTSSHSSNATPKISTGAAQTENTTPDVQASMDWKVDHEIENKVQQVEGDFSIPLVIIMLLILSYGALTGSLYLVLELKK